MLQLRAIDMRDLPFLYQWENDAAAWADGATHNPISQDQLRAYIRESAGDIFKDGQLRLMAEGDGETIGCIDLFDFEPRSRRAALGMYISPQARGKGWGKQMVEAVEHYAFSFLGLHQLYAIIAEDNPACLNIYREANYLQTGVLLDWKWTEQGFVNALLLQKVIR
ncbi:MAG: GNAT family N-acetyltransferase [Paludibacteraceae bacterium]|nr:GNAT family N-acetyltransferase [Paludibacteraceae bacterium]